MTIFCHCCACSRNTSHFLPESDTSADVLDELECKSCCFPTNEQEQKHPMLMYSTFAVREEFILDTVDNSIALMFCFYETIVEQNCFHCTDCRTKDEQNDKYCTTILEWFSRCVIDKTILQRLDAVWSGRGTKQL